jgi:serine/threonine protein kinase
MGLGAWWRQHKINSEKGYELMRGLFQYDPDRRLTAHEALAHEWFQEVPLPTKKYVACVSTDNLLTVLFLFFSFNIVCSSLARNPTRLEP